MKAKHWITIDAWTTVAGKTIEYQINGEIFVRKDDGSATIEKESGRTIFVRKDDNDETNEKNGRKAGRIPNIVKWIEKHCERGSTFNLDEYYEKNPNDEKFGDKIQKYISDMIADKKLTQISNKKFQVN